MNEADVSRKLRLSLVSAGAVVWKISDRFHAARPDLLAVYEGVTSFIEVKIHPNKLTPLQTLTLTELYNVGAPTFEFVYFPLSKTYSIRSGHGVGEVFTDIREATKWLLTYPSYNTK